MRRIFEGFCARHDEISSMPVNFHRIEELKRKPGVIHPRLGDLSKENAVIMAYTPRFSITEREPLFIHLTVTGLCNARCKGCINTNITIKDDYKRTLMDSHGSTVPERDSKAILNLAAREKDEDIVICFYGGEPLLAPEKMEAICTELEKSAMKKRFRYLIYTNGELLDRFVEKYPELAGKIWLYAIGIDGQEEQHNAIKRGTHLSRIQQNIENLVTHHDGTVLMWSTLREEQSLIDCYREFSGLFSRKLVHQFFWHWVESDSVIKDFEQYLFTYEQELRSIMVDFIASLAGGLLLPITHVNELIVYLLTGRERGTSACAVEKARNYDIMNGKIHACADLPPGLAIGEISDDGGLTFHTAALGSLIDYKKPLGCYQCGIHAYCGGRCPVQAHSGEPERLIQYCQLMRLHVGTIVEFLPSIEREMGNNGLTAQDLYDQSAFYAQFTDVTP